MDEVYLLLEKAELKLNSAKILFENRIYDDAISRAYYCMYYAAKALLCMKDKHPRTHRGLLSQFGLEFVKKGIIDEYYARAITVAQERRERADYDIYYCPSREEAEAIIEDAERFLERIKKAVEELKK
ncbi:HEPN domain-containing protein [Archaeoglobus veneficus]|uniref:HEPN domain protein n=1 Tax=Archaeoglobus veneficus (strain DSM 11195 / SNP6) TaxID=693661 RepID=F2KQD2_ARCVS|nr:HEPN domain-containing protein [Archaeoglobus veneficus]AEA46565.1 HEPN domain protein [Archaeoglobus veneficus SNP6]